MFFQSPHHYVSFGFSFLLTSMSISSTSASPYSICKSVPGDSNWPPQSEWNSLNTSIGGRLLSPLPPAAACDRAIHVYNNDTCTAVGLKWSSSAFHADDPVSVDWPNFQSDSCLPSVLTTNPATCDLKPFPKYVVNASESKHIVQAVKFAKASGVRLAVKGTGHDFLGRSTAPGLSIWTRYLRGIETISSFVPASCHSCDPVPVMRIAAGHSMQDVYQEAKKQNVTIVVGDDANVGIGGFITGGGHSLVSPIYGLAVDNVVEMELVTPNGDIVVANDYQYQDLFWATRGGGGATFGIVLSITIRTYSSIRLSRFTLAFNSTHDEASISNNSNWYAAVSNILTQVPALSDSKVMGGISTYPLSLFESLVTGLPPAESSDNEAMGFVLRGITLEKDMDQMMKLIDPILRRVNATQGIVSRFETSSNLSLFDSTGLESQTVGRNALVTSRLWDKKAFANDKSLKSTLQVFKKDWFQGTLVTGPGVRNVSVNSSSVNPSWRNAYLHTMAVVGFQFKNDTAEQETQNRLTNVLGNALRNQAPDTGCYLNEADPKEPDFRQAFWGGNYQRLIEIKRKYDQDGVFWCDVCVGAEDWILDTSSGRLCRPGH